jgi:MoaA/NifB/PqqE/SkfB family radical SAM enzyme
MKRIQLENRTDLANEIPLESPYVIFIDPSNACNFQCKFCMNSKIRNPQVMDFELYKKIIDDLQDFKNPIKTIRLYGFGEPLMNKKFPDMVAYAKQSNKVLKVDTTTNASLFNRSPKSNGRTNVEEIIDAGIDRINISIEGINAEQYKKFCGFNICWNNFIENLTYLYQHKKQCEIYIKINGDYLSEAEQQQFFDIFTPISDGRGIEHTMNCWYDTKVNNINKEVGVYGQPLDNVQICPYIFYTLVFQASGYASICFLDWDQRILLGHINKQSVKQIWDGKFLKNIQMNMLKGNKYHICRECDQLIRGMPVNLDISAEKILRRMLSV